MQICTSQYLKLTLLFTKRYKLYHSLLFLFYLRDQLRRDSPADVGREGQSAFFFVLGAPQCKNRDRLGHMERPAIPTSSSTGQKAG